MQWVDQACEEAKKKVLSTSTETAGSSSAASLASIVDKVMESDVLRAPMKEVRDVGINMWLQGNPLPPKQVVDPTEAAWLRKAIQFAMLVPNAVAMSLGDKGRVQLFVPYADFPGIVPPYKEDKRALDDDVVGFGATMWILHRMWLKHTAEIQSESLSKSSQEREEGLDFEILRHKARPFCMPRLGTINKKKSRYHPVNDSFSSHESDSTLWYSCIHSFTRRAWLCSQYVSLRP